MADLSVTAADCRPLPGAIVQRFTAGGTFTVGDLVYVVSDGEVEIADASAVTTGRAVGVCVSAPNGATAVVATDAVDVVVYGPVAGFTSLAEQTRNYVSITAGKAADAAPTAAASISRVFGWNKSATILFVDPADGMTAQAAITNLTDSTGGTANDTLAVGTGEYILSIPIDLVSITGNADVVTDLVIPHKFRIEALDWNTGQPVTTGSKLTTLALEIGATPVTGGAVALTSANCTPLGALVAGSAVTAADTGAAAGTITVTSASTTAFSEGSGFLNITIQNMDTADNEADLAAKLNEALVAMEKSGIIVA